MIHRIFNHIKYDIRQIQYIRHADEINCFIDVPAKDHCVNIYDYQPKKYNYTMPQGSPYNLGDYLGKVIIKYLLDQKGIPIDKYISKRKHLFAVGSNIMGSDIKGNYQNATIWGSGCIKEPSRREYFFQKISHRHLDIRAVRGPLSREILLRLGHECPEVYGDPAILLPIIYEPRFIKKRDYLIIPQLYCEKSFREKNYDGFIVSMNTDDYKSVIDEICASEIVYTSSLHGIILAESYGIPAVFFRGLDKVFDFKYRDWYSSTKRPNVHFCETLEEALNTTPPPIPGLEQLQQGLLDCFPYDLWES